MKTNSIYEALNNIDDKFVSEAAKVRRKRPMALMITAASLAAALALAVGIRNWGGIIGNYISPADAPVKQGGAFYQGEEWTSAESDAVESDAIVESIDAIVESGAREPITMKICSKGDSTEYGIDFNTTPQDYTIPEEYLSSDILGFKNGYTDTVPSELFPKFGITMLTSDNFTDTKSVYDRIHDSDGNIYSWEPCVWITPISTADDTTISFTYYLYDKKIDRNIAFTSIYYSDIFMLEDNMVFRYEIDNYKEEEADAEVIELNDGSQCMVTDSRAFFSYNGVMYGIGFDHDGLGSSIKELKQVLADLGVL